MAIKFFFCLLVVCFHISTPAVSQSLGDSNWDKRFGIPGLNGVVSAMAVRGDEIVVGGNFTVAGNLNVSSMAIWNKTTHQWKPLNNGLSGGTISAIAVYKEIIFVAGDFKLAYGKKISPIVKFENDTWQSLADSISPVDSAAIKTLHIKNDSLFVGGLFNGVNGNPTQNLAVYSITNKNWTTFGNNGTDGPINSIVSDEGSIYVGGDFIFAGNIEAYNVAKLTHGIWESVGDGTQGIVHSLLFHKSNLYAGGSFSQAGVNTVAYGIARWSGSKWFALGRGIEGLYVSSVLPYGKDIIITGGFNIAGTDTVNNIALWDGAKWSKIGAGTSGIINTAVVTEDTTLFCGGFFSLAGNGYADHIAMLKNKSWSSLSNQTTNGLFQDISAMAQGRSLLFVAGSLDDKGSAIKTVATWNGNKWEISPYKFNGSGIKSIIVDTSNNSTDLLFVAGDFNKIDNKDVPPVMAWSKSWIPTASNLKGKVNSICKFKNKLYAGGDFILDGDSTKKNIAVINFSTLTDTAKWQIVGSGSDSIIHALAVDTLGTLYCGGNFKSISGVNANNVAMFKNNQFMPLTDGCDSTVLALYIGLDNELMVGGKFKNAGGKNSHCLAMFDGSNWHQPISLISGSNPKITCITQTNDGIIYVGGNFDSVDLVPAKSVAKYDRGFWKGLGSGIFGKSSSVYDLEPEVKTLANNNTFLFVGGDFSHAGSNPSSAFAVWNAYLTNVKLENNPNFINTFPNPAQNYLNIQIDKQELKNITEIKNLKINIFNTLSELVATLEAGIYADYLKLDVSQLQSGNYSILIKSGSKSFYKSFVIAR